MSDKIIDLVDTTNQNQLINGLEKNRNIDIVDFETVSFDTKSRKAKRSLSLNVYKYEQILGPKEDQHSSVESLIPEMTHTNHINSCKDIPSKTTKFINLFGIVALSLSLIMMAGIIFLVIGNRSEGKKYLWYENSGAKPCKTNKNSCFVLINDIISFY